MSTTSISASSVQKLTPQYNNNRSNQRQKGADSASAQKTAQQSSHIQGKQEAAEFTFDDLREKMKGMAPQINAQQKELLISILLDQNDSAPSPDIASLNKELPLLQKKAHEMETKMLEYRERAQKVPGLEAALTATIKERDVLKEEVAKAQKENKSKSSDTEIKSLAVAQTQLSQKQEEISSRVASLEEAKRKLILDREQFASLYRQIDVQLDKINYDKRKDELKPAELRQVVTQLVSLQGKAKNLVSGISIDEPVKQMLTRAQECSNNVRTLNNEISSVLNDLKVKKDPKDKIADVIKKVSELKQYVQTSTEALSRSIADDVQSNLYLREQKYVAQLIRITIEDVQQLTADCKKIFEDKVKALTELLNRWMDMINQLNEIAYKTAVKQKHDKLYGELAVAIKPLLSIAEISKLTTTYDVLVKNVLTFERIAITEFYELARDHRKSQAIPDESKFLEQQSQFNELVKRGDAILKMVNERTEFMQNKVNTQLANKDLTVLVMDQFSNIKKCENDEVYAEVELYSADYNKTCDYLKELTQTLDEYKANFDFAKKEVNRTYDALKRKGYLTLESDYNVRGWSVIGLRTPFEAQVSSINVDAVAEANGEKPPTPPVIPPVEEAAKE